MVRVMFDAGWNVILQGVISNGLKMGSQEISFASF